MAEGDALRLAAVLAADPELDVVARLDRASTAIRIRSTTPLWSSVSNGLSLIPPSRYAVRNLPSASSREKPSAV